MRHSPAGPAPPLLTVDNPAPPLVRISRKGADRAASGHPWIFRSDVLEHAGARPGDVVKVVDPRGATLGTAHYSSTSQICLRLLSIRDEPITREFFDRRLAAALEYRAGIVGTGTDVWRMVYGEADQLPALIIDRYGRYAVLQTLSQGMDRARDVFVRWLLSMGVAGIVERNDVAVRAKEALPLKSGVLAGEVPGTIDVLMNGLPWRADLLHAQKTGIFLDQRENYLAVAGYARGRALDCFTSTGGFAIHMARSCRHVEAIDSSAPSLALAEQNRVLNRVENVSFRQADVFAVLAAYARAGEQYDTIVLDPPAFTKTRAAREGAFRGYKEINLRALRLLRPGGILVSCSCSHHFSEAMLLQTIATATLDARRSVKVLERRTQARDHPILLTVPETHYLKCLILYVT